MVMWFEVLAFAGSGFETSSGIDVYDTKFVMMLILRCERNLLNKHTCSSQDSNPDNVTCELKTYQTTNVG